MVAHITLYIFWFVIRRRMLIKAVLSFELFVTDIATKFIFTMSPLMNRIVFPLDSNETFLANIFHLNPKNISDVKKAKRVP